MTSEDTDGGLFDRPGRLSKVTGESVAYRPALAQFRAPIHDDLLFELHRYFVALREGKLAAAAVLAARALLPDLYALELAPGLSPGIRERRHRVVQFFQDRALRAGISGSPGLLEMEIRVTQEVNDVFFRRGIHALFPESAEIVSKD